MQTHGLRSTGAATIVALADVLLLEKVRRQEWVVPLGELEVRNTDTQSRLETQRQSVIAYLFLWFVQCFAGEVLETSELRKPACAVTAD